MNANNNSSSNVESENVCKENAKKLKLRQRDNKLCFPLVHNKIRKTFLLKIKIEKSRLKSLPVSPQFIKKRKSNHLVKETKKLKSQRVKLHTVLSTGNMSR